MLAPTNPEVADLLARHQVTDEYAIALDALRRGEPTARVQVQALYLKLRRLMDFSSAKRAEINGRKNGCGPSDESDALIGQPVEPMSALTCL